MASLECDLSDNRIPGYQVSFDKIEWITNQICAHLDLADYDVSVSFVDADEMQTLNLEHREKDRPTDVLSFPQEDWPKPQLVNETKKIEPASQTSDKGTGIPKILGDVVICPEVAKRNAVDIGQGLDREVCFLLVHGILHLCGHDHETPEEEAIMLEQQNIIMQDLLHTPENWADCVRQEKDS